LKIIAELAQNIDGGEGGKALHLSRSGAYEPFQIADGLLCVSSCIVGNT
jgi:hypothetical protein